MEESLGRLRRDESLAVLCLDLDRFKHVNDTLGHPIGDDLLQAVAVRLLGCVRESDVVARLGGDEFAVVQIGCNQPAEAAQLAARIIDVLSAPYDLKNHHVVVGASIGVAVTPTDGSDPDQLLKSADLALYRAKADGRGTYRFFEPAMDARAQTRRLLETELRTALRDGEFELYYQPIVQLRTDEIAAFEALVRWNHPRRGMVAPLDFISVAEESGLIVRLGAWVLRNACAEAATWSKPVRVAVNLSPMQFKSPELAQTVFSAIAASGLAPDRLELEITESALLQDTEATLATLHQLRSFGVRIAMDDFGTGYSSLSYLRSFPFDKIKIDRSFIHELSTRGDCQAIVRAVTGLGSSLGIATTAEGVETHEQLKLLRREGCTEVQGYLFSPPRPAGAVEGLLAARSKYRAVA
jgi:diguanylate cyclase (GGDEF)-like protein